MDICTFWYGGKLRIVDKICLGSMVMAAQNTGQQVKIYSYEELKDVPQGVINCDASEILSKELIKRINPYYPDIKNINNISLLQFSDLFRIMLMKNYKGLWFDTDLYLYKSFVPDVNKIWLARENRNRVGVSVMYIPPDNPIIKEFNSYIASDDILPSWLGAKRLYLKPLLLKIQNKAIITPYIGITAFGNDGISRLAKKYNFFSQAKNKNTFYYWTASKSANIYKAECGLAPLADKNFMGFHIHRKNFSCEIPVEGCFYHWAAKRVANFYDTSIAMLFKQR